ncbi:MAG: DUF4328 domain-containing protein [Chloroflexi bacterium]|nr:DUF4328 domain-containing protein [Chloroflexota bacterium]
MRATWTLALLAVFGLAVIAAAVSAVLEIGLLRDLQDGEAVSVSSAIANDNRQRVVSSLYFVTFVSTAVAFCFWMHRVSRNLGPLGIEGRRFTPRWAVIWWFVPLMQLFRPYQVVREIWRGSNKEASGRSWALLPWWWAAWLAANAMAFVNSAAIFRGDEPGMRITVDLVALARLSLMLAGVVLAFVMVRRITVLQDEKYRGL